MIYPENKIAHSQSQFFFFFLSLCSCEVRVKQAVPSGKNLFSNIFLASSFAVSILIAQHNYLCTCQRGYCIQNQKTLFSPPQLELPYKQDLDVFFLDGKLLHYGSLCMSNQITVSLQHQYYMKGYLQRGFAQDECNCMYVSSKTRFGCLGISKRGTVPILENYLVLHFQGSLV